MTGGKVASTDAPDFRQAQLGKKSTNQREVGSTKINPVDQPPDQPCENTETIIDNPREEVLRCRSCGYSGPFSCDGHRYLADGRDIQRYLCRKCGYRFSNSDHSEPTEQLQRVERQILNCNSTLRSTRQVCVSQTKAMINLATVESQTQEKAAGATTPDQATIKGMIVKHSWWLEKEGRKASTINLRNRALNNLMKKGANLLSTDSVKETIAKMPCQEGTKFQYVAAYTMFASVNGIKWEPPKYKLSEKQPFIPTEAELDQLIASSGKSTSALLLVLKETGMRIGEALRLKWTSLDVERSTLIINDPEKGSNSGVYKVSPKLVGMLQNLPKKSERIFPVTPQSKTRTFMDTRKRTANKLQNPRILQISFHTFRHWKGTMLYHQTKDPFYVMNFLRHRDFRNTMRYIHLERTVFSQESDEFNVKVAKTLEEACKLVKVGFEYITTIEGVQVFRKRQ